MAAISAEQISVAYEVGRDWLGGKIGRTDAVRELVDRTGINAVSAGDLLQVLKAMLSGDRFTRSISAMGADVYLGKIAKSDGKSAVILALSALNKHIEYYESIQTATMHKLRAVRDAWKDRVSALQAVDEWLPNALEQQVSDMLSKPAAERKKLLPPPGTKPKSSLGQIKVYQRSAAVIAEVLIRAGGVCESCLNPAPFLRSSNARRILKFITRFNLQWAEKIRSRTPLQFVRIAIAVTTSAEYARYGDVFCCH